MSATPSQRRNRLRDLLELSEGEGLVVSHLPDIRWLTGFSGSSGLLVLWARGETLVTDGRYAEQVKQECPDVEVHIGSGAAGTHMGQILVDQDLKDVRVQADHASWSQILSWKEAWSGVDVSKAGSELSSLRMSKSSGELTAIQRALAITEETFTKVLERLKEGVSENDVAAEIDYQQRLKGATGAAFDTIVAFSENAALPHARPGNRALRRGDVILMDFGCVVDGYHSDMTRTVSFGNASKDFLEAYESVRSALLRSQESAKAGITGEQLDGVARDELTRHGYGAAFSHSLGHGVGLQIHEPPSVSRRNQQSLVEGCIITLEPGVYLPGHFGIRIENMVQLHSDGCTILNTLDTELIRL